MERNKKLASVYYWKGGSLTKIITMFVCTITMLMSFYLSDRNNSYHFQKKYSLQAGSSVEME